MLLGGLWHGASWTFVVWGALHGFGLAVTRYFQRSAGDDARAGWRLIGACAAIAVLGLVIQRVALADAGTWPQLVALWLCLTPLWAVGTAWLSREQPVRPERRSREVQDDERERAALEPVRLVGDEGLPWRALFRRDRLAGLGPCAPELLRLAMCAAGLGFLAALAWAPSWTWIPLVGLAWALGLAADVAERGAAGLRSRLAIYARRALAVVLVFHYVCLAWIFFRASSFDGALAVLRQIALLETDHANLVPVVATALAVGFACHLWADGSFGWLQRRFVALPAPAQGTVLAAVALVLIRLGQHDILPFIYFQF